MPHSLLQGSVNAIRCVSSLQIPPHSSIPYRLLHFAPRRSPPFSSSTLSFTSTAALCTVAICRPPSKSSGFEVQKPLVCQHHRLTPFHIRVLVFSPPSPSPFSSQTVRFIYLLGEILISCAFIFCIYNIFF